MIYFFPLPIYEIIPFELENNALTYANSIFFLRDLANPQPYRLDLFSCYNNEAFGLAQRGIPINVGKACGLALP